MPASEPRNSDFVQSLERGLAVIRAFDAEHRELALSDVARATGLTRAAARRFLLTIAKLGYVNVAEGLRRAMTENPNLRVMVANGYYVLATPFFATEYTMNHLGLDPTLSSHVSLTYCDAGHMMYTKKACLDSLYKAMTDFYAGAVTVSR